VTALIIIILTLIFLNMVAVGGLLLGLIQSANKAYIDLYSGAVRIRPTAEKVYIQFPEEILNFARSLPGFVSYSPHIQSAAKLEIGYKEKKFGSEVSNVSAPLLAIDPELEMQTNPIGNFMIEGRFLEPDDRDKIVLGSLIAGRGATIAFGEALQNVEVGSKVLATYGNGVQREYTVVGIFKTKVAVRNLQALVTIKELNDVLGLDSPQYSDVSIKIADPDQADRFKAFFTNAGYDRNNRVETWVEAEGSAVNDVNDAMSFIGDIVGAIGLMVGSITIFILIFVNAVSRRKYIGILKAIGIRSGSIIISYVLQGIFYTFIGVGIGILILYIGLIPYFDAHPIDFPFSDASLYVTPDYAAARIGLLFVVAFVSGLVPAYLITKENTLDAILGR
jgi:lipoprotein-releasing system permease protein